MAETQERERQEQEAAQQPVPLTAESIKGEVQSIAKMIKGLGYDVDEKYLNGEYDADFPSVINNTLREFQSIFKFDDNASPEEMQTAILTSLNEAKNTKPMGFFGPTNYEILQQYAQGKGSMFLNRDAVGDKLTQAGYTDHHKENIKGVVEFGNNAEHYFQQIATIQIFTAQQSNDPAAVANAQQRKEQLDQTILQQQQQRPDNQAELSGIQKDILLQMLGFMMESFPDILPMLDGLVRQFTGGKGILDMLPENLQNDPDFAKIFGDRKADPEEDLRASFIEAFENADDPTAASNALLRSVRAITSLPFGDRERRTLFRQATEESLKEALEGFDKANIEQHADIFADRFMAKMEELNQTNPNTRFRQSAEVIPDPRIDAILEGSGLDGSDLQALFIRQNEAYNNHLNGNHEPLIFTHNGKTYIGGLERESNYFTIKDLSDDDGKAFLQNAYTNYLGSVGKKYGGENINDYTNKAIETARPLDALKSDVDKAHTATIAGRQSTQAQLDQGESKALLATLDRAFESARATRIREQSGYDSIPAGNHEDRKGALIGMRNARDEENLLARHRRARGEDEIRQDEVSAEEWRLTPLRDLMRPGDWRAQYKTHPEAIKAAGLETKPAFFTDTKGNTYAFAALKEYNNERALTTEITAELTRYNALTEEQKAQYAADPAKMDADFNNLSAVAKQYDGLKDAFSVAEIATAKSDPETSFNHTRDADAPEIAASEKTDPRATFNNIADNGSSILAFVQAGREITGQKTPEPTPENIIEHDFQRNMDIMRLGC